jgi:hypothetical protein
MRRIGLAVVLALSLSLAQLAAEAQQPGKIFRIGFLDPSTAAGNAVLVDAFRQELSKLGWIEGKNIAFVYRFAEQKQSDHYHPHRDGHDQVNLETNQLRRKLR